MIIIDGMKEPKEHIKERHILIENLKKDVGETYDMLKVFGFDKFNAHSKYVWKCIYNGYGDSGKIFTRSPSRFRKNRLALFVDGIDDKSVYNKLIETNDQRIFEALHEAHIWIAIELESYEATTLNFKKAHKEISKQIRDNIESFKELQIG